jgi:hypothetical protein
MIVTDARWDAVDAAALGARWDRRRVGERPVSDRTARGRTALQRFAKTSAGGTWPVEAFGEVAAYGEVVWSWHPLLMLSLRRCVGPTGF